MTVVLATTQNHYVGLSGDVKPTAPTAGSEFYETDTGSRYVWDGLAWQYAPRMGG